MRPWVYCPNCESWKVWNFVTLRSYISVRLRRITFKLGNFINFQAFFPVVSTVSVADPRDGPGGSGPPLLIFRPKGGLKGRKKLIHPPPPPTLYQGLDDRNPHALSEGLDPPLTLPLNWSMSKVEKPWRRRVYWVRRLWSSKFHPGIADFYFQFISLKTSHDAFLYLSFRLLVIS